jgi:hypothetical protein
MGKNKEKESPVTFGYVRQFDKEEALKTRTIEFIFSTSARDRHRTVLNQDNWNLDNFNNNGIVGYQHNVYGGDLCNGPDPDDVIGKSTAQVMENVEFGGKVYEKALVGKITFETKELNEKADKIFRKILNGTLKAVSVGFMPLKDEHGEYGYYGDDDEARGRENETYYFYGQELLEISVVNIPANPEALQRSMHEQLNRSLMYIMNKLGKDVAYEDVTQMTVGEVLKQLRMTPEEREKYKQKNKQKEKPSKEYYQNLKSKINGHKGKID